MYVGEKKENKDWGLALGKSKTNSNIADSRKTKPNVKQGIGIRE